MPTIKDYLMSGFDISLDDCLTMMTLCYHAHRMSPDLLTTKFLSDMENGPLEMIGDFIDEKREALKGVDDFKSLEINYKAYWEIHQESVKKAIAKESK